jgi:hypothetical protein
MPGKVRLPVPSALRIPVPGLNIQGRQNTVQCAILVAFLFTGGLGMFDDQPPLLEYYRRGPSMATRGQGAKDRATRRSRSSPANPAEARWTVGPYLIYDMRVSLLSILHPP